MGWSALCTLRALCLLQVDENGAPAVQFAFPHGATVLAQEPAVPILSTGTLAHPNNMAAGRVGAVGLALGHW